MLKAVIESEAQSSSERPLPFDRVITGKTLGKFNCEQWIPNLQAGAEAGSAFAHYAVAQFLRAQGKSSESLNHLKRACELDASSEALRTALQQTGSGDYLPRK
ncbi:MAG: hypothetical protein NVV63_14490 [Opitutus sp.]|nr:hypothetical protein [Opitutus sp.]